MKVELNYGRHVTGRLNVNLGSNTLLETLISQFFYFLGLSMSVSVDKFGAVCHFGKFKVAFSSTHSKQS